MSPDAATHLLAALRGALPPDTVTTDPADLETYGRDWTKVFAPAPLAVALPRTAAEVATILGLCSAHEVGVVPSGGRTGLSGGAVAARGELVLSLARMRHLGEIDHAGLSVRVEAGAVTEAVHRHVEAHDLTWPIDFASKGSSTVGGNIATNAGGVKVIRWGLTRSWVLGLEVVLADGTALSLNGALEKNNTGTDLRQLFIGSEGTLGVITAATLKLARLPGRLDVMLFAVRDLAGVLKLLSAARAGPFVLHAFECFSDRCHARVERHRRLAIPLGRKAPWYALVEVEAHLAEDVMSWVEEVVNEDLVLDGTLAQDRAQARALWALRESVSESLAATGTPHKNDIALPIAALEPFTAELESTLAARWKHAGGSFEICIFGHVGDGNLHVNVMKPDGMSMDEFLRHAAEADATTFELVRKHGGSISAEHGIGLLKKDALSFSRSPAELAVMRAIKHALDPKGILNPGKILSS